MNFAPKYANPKKSCHDFESRSGGFRRLKASELMRSLHLAALSS